MGVDNSIHVTGAGSHESPGRRGKYQTDPNEQIIPDRFVLATATSGSSPWRRTR